MANAAAMSRRERTVCVVLDDSQPSQSACEWVAKNVLQPGDIVHLVTGVPSTAAPTKTLGVWEDHAMACSSGQYIGGARIIIGYCLTTYSVIVYSSSSFVV
jgi:hypothetical protein